MALAQITPFKTCNKKFVCMGTVCKGRIEDANGSEIAEWQRVMLCCIDAGKCLWSDDVWWVLQALPLVMFDNWLMLFDDDWWLVIDWWCLMIGWCLMIDWWCLMSDAGSSIDARAADFSVCYFSLSWMLLLGLGFATGASAVFVLYELYISGWGPSFQFLSVWGSGSSCYGQLLCKPVMGFDV